jgi:hypothetical protein
MRHRAPQSRFGRPPTDGLTLAVIVLIPLTALALAMVAMTIWWRA